MKKTKINVGDIVRIKLTGEVGTAISYQDRYWEIDVVGVGRGFFGSKGLEVVKQDALENAEQVKDWNKFNYQYHQGYNQGKREGHTQGLIDAALAVVFVTVFVMFWWMIQG